MGFLILFPFHILFLLNIKVCESIWKCGSDFFGQTLFFLPDIRKAICCFYHANLLQIVNPQRFWGIFIVFPDITNPSPAFCVQTKPKKKIFIENSVLRKHHVFPVCQDNFNLMTFAAVASICCSQKTNVLFFMRHAVFRFPQDYNDEIRQEQLRELSLLNGSDESSRGRSAQGRSIRPATTISTR